MAEHAVHAATSEQEQAVVDVLTLAFAQDPMARAPDRLTTSVAAPRQ